jgi:hypothetical protein
MNKATTTEQSSGFAAGVARNAPSKGSKAESGYKTSPSEPTVRPIQKGQTETHYDKDPSGRPTIPASKTTTANIPCTGVGNC